MARAKAKPTTKKKAAPLPKQITFRYEPESASVMDQVKELTGEKTGNKAINKVIQMYPEKVAYIEQLESELQLLAGHLKKLVQVKDSYLKAKKEFESIKLPKDINKIVTEQMEKKYFYRDY